MTKLIIRNLPHTSLAISVPTKTILKHIQEAYIDWMHACGGKGRCTTCRINVLGGMENMSSLSAAEIKYRQAGKLKNTERLTCQCYAYGDVLAEIPLACQLPHIEYTI